MYIVIDILIFSKDANLTNTNIGVLYKPVLYNSKLLHIYTLVLNIIGHSRLFLIQRSSTVLVFRDCFLGCLLLLVWLYSQLYFVCTYYSDIYIYFRPFRLYDANNEQTWGRVKRLDKGQVYTQVHCFA